jgi:zinc protease
VKVTSVEGVTEYRFPNGLRVLMHCEPSSKQFTANITYRVGSRDEGAGEAGMAHLLEHMLFKGTPEFDHISAQLEHKGAESNAATGFDSTNFYETMDSTPENLDFALRLEASRMRHARISQQELQSEFKVVRNEFEIFENDNSQILGQRMKSAEYLWHPYGRAIIGAKSDIEKVPATALAAFYKRHYRPDNATLVLTGNFDEKQTLALLEKTVGQVARPHQPLPQMYTVEPVQDGERTVSLERNGSAPEVAVAYHGVQGASPDHAAEAALVFMLTDDGTGGLVKSLLDTGLATGVSGDSDAMLDPGDFSFQATPAPGVSPRKVERQMLATIESIAKEGIDPEELARFKALSLADFRDGWKDPEELALNLVEPIANGDWRLMFLERDRIQALTPEDVRRFAEDYLKRSNRTVGLFLPTPRASRAPASKPVDVAATVKGYEGGAAMQVGEALASDSASLESRTHRSTLSNGLKVGVLQKKTRGDVIEAIVSFRVGDEKSLQGKHAALDVLSPLLLSGPKGMTHAEFDDRMAELHADFSSESGDAGDPNLLTFRLSTDREHLADALALVAKTLRNPRLDPEDLEEEKIEDLGMMDEFRTDPQSRGEIELSRKESPHPKGSLLGEPSLSGQMASIRATKIRDVRALHRLAGGNNAAIAIVGDADPAQIQALLEKELGTWKTRTPAAPLADPYRRVKGGVHEIHIADRAMAWVGMGEQVNLSTKDPDFPALMLANQLLGGGDLSRLNQKLREQNGLSYWTDSSLYEENTGKKLLFEASASAPSEGAGTALQWMQEEVEKLRTEPLAQSELDEARSLLLMQLGRALNSGEDLALALVTGLQENTGFDENEKLMAALRQVTPEQVTAAAQKYLDPARMVSVKSGSLSA